MENAEYIAFISGLFLFFVINFKIGAMQIHITAELFTPTVSEFPEENDFVITSSVPEPLTPVLELKTEMDVWQTVINLLKEQKYEEVLDVLDQQDRVTLIENTPFLKAAEQICHACIQHQNEIESYREAQVQAMLREQELKQQLINMFELMSPAEAKTGNKNHHRQQNNHHPQQNLENNPAQFTKRNGLWQRVQTFLGHVEGAHENGSLITETDLTPMPAGEDAYLNKHETTPTAQNNPQSEATTTDNPQRPTLAVYCLGPFRVYLNGRLIENWAGNKAKSIFKYMLLHNDQPANHEVLMNLFWPGDEPEAARRNLYQAIYVIRQALQDNQSTLSHIICQDSAYSFNPDINIWVDSTVFEAHYQNGRLLQREGKAQEAINEFEIADSLYEGDFLREDIYEEWTLVHRERLKHAHLDLLDRLSKHYWTEKQYTLAISYGKKILQGDNCREDIHRRLMLAHFHQGQRHLAIKQYHLCKEILSEELGVEPMAETSDLYQRIINNS